MSLVLIHLKQLVSSCLHLLQPSILKWTKPPHTSLLLGTLTDAARGKSELVAENAVDRQATFSAFFGTDVSSSQHNGQADLDLLKLRVLHHSPKSLERKNKKKQAQQKDHLKIPKERKKNTNSQLTTEVISKVA